MKKVAKGQPFSPKADTWNAFIDAAQFVRQHQTGITSDILPGGGRSGIVLIRNASGEDQNQLAILGIDDLAIKPEDTNSIQRFRSESPVFDCKKLSDIDATKYHEMKFVILAEPIKQNQCGRAMIAGMTPVKLDVKDEDHEYASPLLNDTTKLQTACDGPCRIVWKEPAIGEKWGLVSFPINDFPRIRIKNDTGSTLKDGYACMVDSAGDKPWMLNVKKPDGDSLLHILPYAGADLEAGKTATIRIGEVMRFAIESSGGIAPGDFIGTQDGSFNLAKNKFGFLVLATETTSEGDFAYVRYSGLPPVIKAVADSSGDTIDVKRCDSDGNTEGDTFTLDIIPEDDS
jgi:hypothetical protein